MKFELKPLVSSLKYCAVGILVLALYPFALAYGKCCDLADKLLAKKDQNASS